MSLLSLLFVAVVVLTQVLPAATHAQSDPYVLTVDGHVYDIRYTADAQVLAMEIDQELNSLLIGLDGARDSVFSIHLPDEMISAENDQFVVLVDWIESDYEVVADGQQHAATPDAPATVIEFFVPAGTLEIEIIGTHVIPEFPAGMTMPMMALAAAAIVLGTTIAASGRRGGLFLGRNLV